MSLTRQLSNATLRYFSMICSYSVAFTWDQDGNIYFEKVKGLRKMVWYFQEFCTIASWPLLVFHLYMKWNQYLEPPTRNTRQLMINIFYLMIYPFSFTFQFVFCKYGQEIVSLVNHANELVRHFENHYLSKGAYDRDRNKRNFAISVIGVKYIIMTCVVICPLYYKYCQEGRYLSSHALGQYFDREDTRPIALTIGFIFELWFSSTKWAGLTIQMYINLLYLQTMSTSMKGLRRLVEYAPVTKEDKKEAVSAALLAYSKLRLLSSMYNKVMGQHFLSRFKSTAALSCVASAFMLVKLFGSDFILTSFTIGCTSIFVGVLSVMAQSCSRIHENSHQLRSFLLSETVPSAILHRKMKCFKVISVKVGNFFPVRKVTPLTILAMVSNTTMTLLMSVSFSF